MAGFDDVAALLGGAPSSKYGTPPDVLDRLQQVESSGNPHAVNPQTGAMGPYQFMPATVATLRHQGLKFDPFDPQQSRDAADYLIQQKLKETGGDMRKALAAYGGFVTKDPTTYVNKVLGPQPGAFDDAVGLLTGTTKVPTTAPAAAPNANATAVNSHKFTPAEEREGEHEVAANVVTGLGASLYGGLKGIGSYLTTGVSDLAHGKSFSDANTDALNAGANAVTQAQQDYTYQPRTAAGQDKLAGFNSGYNPLTWIPRAGEYLGGKTADVTGSPALGAAVNAGTQVFGPAAVAKGIQMAGRAVTPAALPPRIEPSLDAPPQGSPNALQSDPLTTQPQAARVTIPSQLPAPRGPSQPIQPPQGVSLELPRDQQVARAQVLQQVGLTDVRRSAITGDPKAAATDYQTSGVDSPAGNYLKAKFAAERDALENHADSIVQGTGGTIGTDQTANLTRGNAIVAPLDAYKAWFDKGIKQLYSAADERAQGVPAPMENTRALVAGDQADFLGTTDGEALLRGVQARMKSLGMTGEDGATTATVQQAEQLKQYLNDQWSPRTSRLIGKLKDAIDDDVTSAAGEDIYAQARAMRAQRARVLDDPTGVAKIMDSDPNNPMNRATPYERVPATVASMSVAQLNHLVEILKESPPEIQPQAQQAIAEIKSQFANQLADVGKSQKGQWNAKGVNNFLKNNSERMATVFTPEELQRIGVLRDAGQILQVDGKYPGAAVQEHNLIRAGTMGAVRTGAAALGSTVGGPIGGGIGAYIGDRAATALGDRASLNAAQRRTVPVRDFLKNSAGK